jgi:hypothetical protein
MLDLWNAAREDDPMGEAGRVARHRLGNGPGGLLRLRKCPLARVPGPFRASQPIRVGSQSGHDRKLSVSGNYRCRFHFH